MSEISHITGPEAFADAFSVSRETVIKLEAYARLLIEWQKTINLVAPSTLDDIWHRHLADSAQLVAMARRRPSLPLRWLDVGSGAGFPGLVVAIMLSGSPGWKFTLIESDQRKSAFLREVARQTGVPVDILSIRIEKAATQFNLPLPGIVSARALAPLDRLLSLVKPFFGPDTMGLFLKGREVEREIEAARDHWQFEYALRPSLTDGAARIVMMWNVKANSEE